MTKPTIEEKDAFRNLLKKLIDMKTPLENAIEMISRTFKTETLSALLEEYDQGEALFTPVIGHEEFMDLLVHFCKLNPNILQMPFKEKSSDAPLSILGLILEDPIKYNQLYDWVKSIKPELLNAPKGPEQQASDLFSDFDFMESFPELFPTNPTLTTSTSDLLLEAILDGDPEHNKALSPEEQFDEKLNPFININLLVDNSILDAFLYKEYKNKLAERRMALMPTIRSTEAISPELLQAIREGKPLTYTTHVTIENDQILPVLEDHSLPPSMRFAIWPVSVSNIHYGVFILDLRQDRSPSSTKSSYYIEPLNYPYMTQLMCTTLEVQLPEPCEPNLLRQLMTSFMHSHFTNQLTSSLSLSEDNIDYFFLQQDPTTNYCSDNVIATIDWLASDNVDLLNNPKSIDSLQFQDLRKDMVRTIRLLEVKQFGMGYLWLQLPEKLKTPATRTQIDALEKMQSQLFPKKETIVQPPAQIASRPSEEDIEQQPKQPEQQSELWCRMFPNSAEASAAPSASITEKKDEKDENSLSA